LHSKQHKTSEKYVSLGLMAL